MEERVKKDKIVNGTVHKKKKGGLSKFAEIFIAEDAGDVKTYIFRDVVVPAITDLIVESIKKSAEMIFYGGAGVKQSSSGKRYTNYTYSSNKDRDRRRDSYSRSYRSYDEITYKTKGDAVAVLEHLDNMMDEYGVVTILDLYDIVGVSGSNADDKYGWTDLHTAKIVHSSDGWIIKLPRAMPID